MGPILLVEWPPPNNPVTRHEWDVTTSFKTLPRNHVERSRLGVNTWCQTVTEYFHRCWSKTYTHAVRPRRQHPGDVQTAEYAEIFKLTGVEVNKGREAFAFSVSSIRSRALSGKRVEKVLPKAVSDDRTGVKKRLLPEDCWGGQVILLVPSVCKYPMSW